MAAFALYVSHVLERGRARNIRGKRPSVRQRYVIESPINRQRVGIVADDMTRNAVFAEMIRAYAIDGILESSGVERFTPGVIHIFQIGTAPVTERADLNAPIIRSGDTLHDVRRTAASRSDD
jgi:hypothetical protein